MKALFLVGLAVLILGILSLFVAVPHREHHGVKVGGADIGVDTTESHKIPPVLSAVLIVAGAGMMLGSCAGRS